MNRWKKQPKKSRKQMEYNQTSSEENKWSTIKPRYSDNVSLKVLLLLYWRESCSEKNIGGTWDPSTKSTQIITHLSDTMFYEKLNHAISQLLMDNFQDQQHVIVEQTTRNLQGIFITSEMPEVCVDVYLQIDHYCDGRILLALEESSSVDGMVPASESSIELLEPMEADERNSNDECLVCLDELGEETDVLRLPCSHMFHAECITKWLQNSHYCPLCRFEMPTD